MTTHRCALLSSFVLLACVAQAAVPYAGKPYQEQPQAIPGRVQAELYDAGGEGVAYHDSDAVNNGSGKLNTGDSALDRFRQDEGVDISYTKRGTDTTYDGGGEKYGELYVGWTEAGEWLKYTVEVKATGMYRMSAHVSSKDAGSQIAVAFDGIDQLGPITLMTSEDYHRWRVLNLGQVYLEKGAHAMTLSIVKGGFINVDYLKFAPAAAPPPAPKFSTRFQPVDVFEQVRRMRRGVNIVGYDPLWDNFEDARFKERYFKMVHDGGFQTVRVGLHALAHMDCANRLDPEWLRTLDWVVKNATTAGLYTILDLHNYNDCGKDAAGCAPRLRAFWRQISERYKDAPANVMFEILNEPSRQITPEIWNGELKDALAIIRQTNPTRIVVIGSANFNSFKALDKLELPENDRNIIVTVHYYLPSAFTHQGAWWNAANRDRSGITWGSDAEKRAIEEDFGGVQQWSKAHHRPILLGEFGSYDKAPMESRERYTAFVARTAESLGWAWTYWQFDSDFIVYNIDKDEWVRPIWKALVP
jgi:endoglucanase